MAFTQSDLDAIDNAIKSNVLKVTYGDGRSVEYRSISDLLSARIVISGEVKAATGASRSTLGTFSRGS
mgnify:CR=1 FL=1